MKKELLNESFLRFLETFRVCGTFLYEYNDEAIEYLLFEKFDDHLIIDLSDATLNVLVDNNLITLDLKDICREFREISLSVFENQNYEYTALFVKKSYAWKHILKLADLIRQELMMVNKFYDLTPIALKDNN